MDNSCLVPIGRAVKPHGVRGEVKIFPYGDTLAEMDAGEKLFVVRPEGGVYREFTLVSLRAQKRHWIAQFEEISEMDQAQALSGIDLSVPRDRLPKLPEGEYYHFELIGLSVETTEGRHLGPLCAIMETGGNDVYVVDREGKELLIPAVEDVVCEIDLQNKRMVVDLPEGLE